jgi:pimeloyl-ACP methyl ester carboxylesterase
MFDAMSASTTSADPAGGLYTGTITANGLEFGYLSAGKPGAALALCLHGFPDTAHTWRHLLPELAAAGYHAVAPFQRGYAPTVVPPDGRYQTGVLAADANALHEAFGADANAVIIGHDWGAPATYGAAIHEPQRWSRVIGMSVPPGGALAGSLTGYRQLKKSWYMFFFQHGLADFVVGLDDLAFLDGLWADWSPDYDAAADLVRVKAALGDPTNLAAAIGYYRTAVGDGVKDPALDDIQTAVGGVISQRALYLHGADDGCIGAEVAPNCAEALGHPLSRIEIVANCGHFLQLERPDEVNRLIVEFLAAE